MEELFQAGAVMLHVAEAAGREKLHAGVYLPKFLSSLLTAKRTKSCISCCSPIPICSQISCKSSLAT